ncbi:glycosyltransferase family 4 protein [Gillisia marina]|uniref:glycosyltransferase family 4 protein n=1 Tax=Gillisia marina TaxID=1167637 RepID=UPI001ED95363|nr:glycosyltransferase family 1 protein [Gillisia marina]
MEKDPIENIKKEDIEQLQRKIDRCDAIAYISNHAKQSANHYLNIPSNLHQPVIYNGNPVIASEEKIAKPIVNFNLNKPFIFCIGQFLEMKNFHSLISMLHHLKSDYQLIIAGNNDKPYKEVVQHEISKFKLEDKVYLAGKISEQEKHYYLQNCEAFVFPSLFEGFGLPPIEAMAYGKPVFLANRTSLPEIGGKYSFYWDSFDGESMATVFTNGMNTFEKQKTIYQKELRNRAQKFNWDTTAKEYIKLYSKILG